MWTFIIVASVIRNLDTIIRRQFTKESAVGIKEWGTTYYVTDFVVTIVEVTLVNREL